MTKKPSAAAILEKFAKNQCTPQEVAWLEAAFNEELKVNEQVFAKEDIEAAHLRMRFTLNKHLANTKKPNKLITWRRMVAAAAIVVLLGIGLIYFTQKTAQIENSVVLTQKVKPGGNKAYLILPNGQQLELSSHNEQVIMKDSIFYENGELIGVSEPAKSLVLQTPRGGQYRLTLADGTKVWLNAASSITYPTRFNSDKREVLISGEVYFEVAHEKARPFIVRTNTQEVQVLGTHFNICAYPEQDKTYTTLIEGKVSVSNKRSGETAILFPEQQATVSQQEKILIKKVNASNAAAWTTGRFSFEGKSFNEVMQELARWYNLDIIYTGAVPNDRFFGGAFRNNELSIILELLESAEINYQIKDRQLIIRTK